MRGAVTNLDKVQTKLATHFGRGVADHSLFTTVRVAAFLVTTL